MSSIDVEKFIRDGFVKVENAFSAEVAAAGRAILWRDTGCDENDPATWTKPVVWLGYYGQEPFRAAVNSPALRAAYDALVGEGRWFPRADLGTFPVRFPGKAEPADDGWHIDAGFPGDDPNDFFQWRINIESKGRALLMLFLFSDVNMEDAPTRIRVGSHLEVARMLEPHGERGLSFMEIAEKFSEMDDGEVAYATGDAGTVYLCHPFLVHAAQPHRGKNPKFMAQPPLISREPLKLEREDEDYSPVETAVRLALTEK